MHEKAKEGGGEVCAGWQLLIPSREESGLSSLSLCPVLKNTRRLGFGVCENVHIWCRNSLSTCTQRMLKFTQSLHMVICMLCSEKKKRMSVST